MAATPWSDHEKNYLLAEIIKAANPPPNVLFSVIQSSQLQPHWEDTPLPPGRSLNSCRHAFEELRRSLSTPMGAAMPPLPPAPVLGRMSTLKRPFPYESTYAGGSSGREIRPKPPASGSAPTQPSPTDPPTKKKRGRPTKAEALAKAEAAASTGMTYGEPSPLSAQRLPSQMAPHSTPAPQPVAIAAPATLLEAQNLGPAPAPTLSSVTGMPIAAMLTPTTREPQSSSHSQSGSSSSRRRRARSTKSEPGASPVQQGASTGLNYESPYATGKPVGSNTPARAAVLRHREDTADVPRSQSTHDAAHDLPDKRPAS